MTGALRGTIFGVVLVTGLGVAAAYAWLIWFADPGTFDALSVRLDRVIPNAYVESVTSFAHLLPMVALGLLTVARMARHGRSGSAARLAALWVGLVWLVLAGLAAFILALALVPAFVDALGWWGTAPGVAFEAFFILDDFSVAPLTVPVIFALWLGAAAVMTAEDIAGRRVARAVAVLAVLSVVPDTPRADFLLGPDAARSAQGVLQYLRQIDYLPAVVVLLAWLCFSLSVAFRLRTFYLLLGTVVATLALVTYNAAALGYPPRDVAISLQHLLWGSVIAFGLLAAAADGTTRLPVAVLALHAVALATLMVLVAGLWSASDVAVAAYDGGASAFRGMVLRVSGIALVVAFAFAGAIALRLRPAPLPRHPVAGIDAARREGAAA